MLQIKRPAVGFLASFALITSLLCSNESSEAELRRRINDNCNNLELSSLCVKKMKANCFDARQASAKRLCAGMLGADSAVINSGCINQLQTQDVCVTGTLWAANIMTSCQKVRATAVFTTTTTYTLGTNLNYDLILDDPNNNVTTAPFAYTAPKSGYYLVSLQIDQQNLVLFDPSKPVLGVPVANLEIVVNNQIVRQAFQPFLTFNNAQNTNITMIVSLKTGDIVTGVYELFQLNGNSGLSSIAGTAEIIGNGTEQNVSLFKIILLGEDCSQLVPPCPVAPCAPIGCEPCYIDCCDCDESI